MSISLLEERTARHTFPGATRMWNRETLNVDMWGHKYNILLKEMTEKCTTCIQNSRQRVMTSKRRNQVLGCKRKLRAFDEKEVEQISQSSNPSKCRKERESVNA